MQKLRKKEGKRKKELISILDAIAFGPNPFSRGRCEIAEYLREKRKRNAIRS